MFSGMSSSCLPAEEERRTGDADNASSPAHSLAREPLYKVLGNKLMSKQSKPLTLVLTFMVGSAVARLKVSVLITEKPTMEKSKSHQAHIRTAGGVWFLYM